MNKPVAIIAFVGLLSAHAFSVPQTNAACPSNTGKVTSSVSGEEAQHTDELLITLDQIEAQEKAKQNLLNKLGRISGVICDICETSGLQCQRSVQLGALGLDEPTYTDTYISAPFPDDGYKSVATWSGDYVVLCGVCQANP
ncbi:MAG: hypothetical protein ACYS26_17235 [Planctomycetota bacterium]|jgi:hypothetical protein